MPGTLSLPTCSSQATSWKSRYPFEKGSLRTENRVVEVRLPQALNAGFTALYSLLSKLSSQTEMSIGEVFYLDPYKPTPHLTAACMCFSTTCRRVHVQRGFGKPAQHHPAVAPQQRTTAQCGTLNVACSPSDSRHHSDPVHPVVVAAHLTHTLRKRI